MHRSTWSVAAAVLLAACGSGSEASTVELTRPMGEPNATVALSGEAVENGIVCDSATVARLGFEDLEGNAMTGEEVDAIAGESTDFVWYDELTCEDGSGSWVVLGEQLTAMSEMDMGGVNEDATRWTVERGTGDYENLTGEGNDTVDFAAGVVTSVGEMQTN
jgi:hypothetical protein